MCVMHNTLQDAGSVRHEKFISVNQTTETKQTKCYNGICRFKSLDYYSDFWICLFLQGAVFFQANHPHGVKKKTIASPELIFS